MRTVFLTLAHRRPEQVALLVRTLTANAGRVYLHVDAKADVQAFISVIPRDNVHIVNPSVSVRWGGFSVVAATLTGLRAIIAREDPPYFVVLLSGQDFPAKPISYIENFFGRSESSAYIRYGRMGTPQGKPNLRYERYWLRYERRFPFVRNVESMLNKVLPARRFPYGLVPYGGTQWWSARHEMVQHVVEFVDSRPDYYRFFRLTQVPDEMFFHTIMLNSPFRERVVCDHLRYARFPPGTDSPEVLARDDIPEVLGSPALIARKFDDLGVVSQLARRLSTERFG